MLRVPASERTTLRCERCQVLVDTRICRYVFVLVAWRGRTDVAKPERDRKAVLCGPCGMEVMNEVERLGGFGLAAPLMKPLGV